MTIHNVTNSAELQSALGKAVGGDRIVLAAGNYGHVYIYNRNYASNVTIETASTTNRAHFDGLFLSNAKNMTFSGLDIGRGLRPGEHTDWKQLSSIYNGTNIKLSNIEFHGSEDNNPKNDGVGLVVTQANNLTIENSNFSEFFRGVSLQRSTDVDIVGNTFETLRSDGITVASTTGLNIDGNRFQDFRPKYGDHADGIQFWNLNQNIASSNVTIKNNVMWFPENTGHAGLGVQGIFIGTPSGRQYKNFTIDNNLIYSNDSWNGMLIDYTSGLRVTNNSVLSTRGDNHTLWIRLENSDSVVLQNNVTDDYRLNRLSGLSESNNLNIGTMPNIRSLFADLNSPDDISDLIISLGGFQPVGGVGTPPPPPPPAPPATNGDAPGTQRPSSKTSSSDDDAADVESLLLDEAAIEAGFDPSLITSFAGRDLMMEHWTAMA